MKLDLEPRTVIDTIADYDQDIWNNPDRWTKAEWHLFDLYLYYSGMNWFQRRKTKKKMRKAYAEFKKRRVFETTSGGSSK